jgi:hypothetical protein
MSSPFTIASKSRISSLKKQEVQYETALDGADQNQTLFVVKNRLRQRDPAGLRHRVGKQAIRLICSFVGGEIVLLCQ